MGVVLTLGNASSPGEELEEVLEEELEEEKLEEEKLEEEKLEEEKHEEEKHEEEKREEEKCDDEPGVESLRGVAPPQELEANRTEFSLIPPQVPS